MPKFVHKAVETLGKAGGFCTLSTGRAKYLTSQVFFVHKFSTAYTCGCRVLAQPKMGNLKVLGAVFCPLSTTPMNTNFNKLYI